MAKDQKGKKPPPRPNPQKGKNLQRARIAWRIVLAFLIPLVMLDSLGWYFWNQGHAVVYWLLILYDYTNLVPTMLLFPWVGFVLMVIIWQIRKRKKGERFKRALPFGNLVASIVIVVGFVAMLLSSPVDYKHRGAAQMNGHVYYLALKSENGKSDQAILYQCDQFGFKCNEVYTTPNGFSEAAPSNTLSLAADTATKKLTLKLGIRPIYTYTPQ